MVIDNKSWTLLERHEPAFYIGLDKFVDHCKPLVNSVGKIRCPCKSCRTILWVSIKHLSDHITRHVFDLGYKLWVHYGEPDLPPPPPVIDNTIQPQVSDMTTLLNDLSYIHPNNKHNEPTQGDIGETGNELTQDTRNEFEEIYASANEELYPGCDYVTRLDFMAKFTYFKVKGKLTDSIFNEMLEFFQNVFPINKGYKLPPSYYAIKKKFKTIGLGYESIHAYEHDCCLFRGDGNKDLDLCPMCNTSRWKDSNTPGKKVPNKVLHYFWIIPRPKSSFMLTLLIPGPKSPGTDIDVYLRPLIEDLKVLWDRKGVETIDVASGQKFNMRAMVLWTINDFFARSSLSGWSRQAILADKIAKPLIELCSLFKQICSATLMEDDMLKTQRKVVDILCDLELIYPPALFDIMIHFVIHLPLEALEDGRIRPRWMFPFERYMKKLKGYVRNKAKQEGSIAKGYVAEEALTFSSHYFRDVTTKFNRPDHNVDPPPPTYNDKDLEVSTTSELFALACGPTWTPISINSCVVDGVRYVVHNRDERRTTQNSGICSPGPDGEMYYGQLQEIIEFKYLLFKIVCSELSGSTLKTKDVKSNVLSLETTRQIDTIGEVFKNDQYILVTQVKQVFYLEDKAKPHWKVIEHVNHKKFSDGGVIVVEEDPDIIHFDNLFDLPISTSLNDLDNATLHIDGQSTEVDSPLDTIDVVDEDDDIIDDEDALPYDLADEDLINVDDDGVDKMLHGPTTVTLAVRIVPHHTMYPPIAVVASLTEVRISGLLQKQTKAQFGRQGNGHAEYPRQDPEPFVKEITDTKGPVPIRFEVRDKQTLMPLGEHAAHWSSYIGEVIRGVPLYHPSWLKVPKERKATLIADTG
nr:hypothetical protein [Tanacetum cinerariifolium]